MSSESPNHSLLKFVILGSSNVGKTSLLNRFVDKKFTNAYKATIGADFKKKEIVISANGRPRNTTMQIWDTAGQERFQALGQAFYRGAEVCVLVYDITKADSFEALETWREEFIAQAKPANEDDFPFLVIGNKLDLQKERAVATSRALNWCRHKNIKTFYECSASDDTNVTKAFEDIATKALTASINKSATQSAYNPVSLGAEANKGGSCAC